MRRTFAVIGFTFYVVMLSLCTLGQTAAQIALMVFAAAAIVCAAVRRLRREAVLVCSLLSSVAACLLFLTAMYTQYLPVRALDGMTCTVSAHLQDLPRQNGGKTVYTLLTDEIGGVPMQRKLALLCDVPIDAELTDRFTFSAKLYASKTPDSDGVWLRAYDTGELVLSADKATLRSSMLTVRRYVTDTMAQVLPGTPGAVLTAMLLGDRDAIPVDVYANMRRSGILHIFSVSGLHLSVFAMTLLRVTERKRVPRGVYVPLCALLVLFVMAATGFPRSCVRAGLMLLLMLFGRLFARRADAVNSLGFSLLCMCAVDPFSAGDVGLQLSALGTFSVVCVMPYIGRIVSKVRIPFYPLCAAVRFVLSAMLLSAAITVVTLPVSAASFGSFSVVAPLTNACMLFAAQWAMTLAAMALPLTVFSPLSFLFRPMLLAAGLLVRYSTAVANFFGSLSFAAMQADDPFVLLWLAGTMLLIAAAVVLRLPIRRKIALVTALSLALLSAAGVLHTVSTHNTVQITALDVGNGTAVLVQSCGETAMIGCGGKNTAYVAAKETSHLSLMLLPRIQTTETACASQTLRSVPADTIVVPETAPSTLPLYFFFDPHVFSGETYRVGDVTIEYLPRSASSAVRLTAYGRTVLMLFAPGCELSTLPQAWLDADALYVRSDVPARLQAENYSLVLLQGEDEHVSLAAQDICAHGGRAVCNGTITIRKNGFIGRKAGVCVAGDHGTGTETAAAAKSICPFIYSVRRGKLS